MTNSPADYMAEAISTYAATVGYRVFVNHYPNDPDNLIFIEDMGTGRLFDRQMRTGKQQELPVVKVIVRARTAQEAYSVLLGLELSVTQSQYRTPMQDGKILHSISKHTTITSLGHEAQTRRCMYMQQFHISVE